MADKKVSFNLSDAVYRFIQQSPQGRTRKVIDGRFDSPRGPVADQHTVTVWKLDSVLSELVSSGRIQCVGKVYHAIGNPIVDTRKPRPKKDPPPESAVARTLPLPFYGAR